MQSFRDLAEGSNFMHTELPRGITPETKDVRGFVEKGLQGARKFSEGREDFGRFVHFRGALEQELGAIAKERKLNPGSIQLMKYYDEAAQRAARRVNKWKIDYTALTPVEQNSIRRVVPFYTWIRKATPTSPRYNVY